MKRILYLVLAISLTCCNSRRYHDGRYRASVFTDGSMSWVRNEEIELNGNEFIYRSLSLADDSVLNEIRTSCIQFPERVEINGKDGVSIVAKFDEAGNVVYGEYTYKKINSEE